MSADNITMVSKQILDQQGLHLSSNIDSMTDDPIIRYERQLTYVMAALKQNPTLLKVFSEKEKIQFCQYFWPDWLAASEAPDLYRYYQRLIQQEPEFPTQADTLLRRFIKANHLHAPIDMFLGCDI